MADEVKAEASNPPPIPILDNENNRGQWGEFVENQDNISRSRTVLIISSVTVVTAILGFLNGLVTVGIPVIAPDLHLDASLILWYVSYLLYFKVDALYKFFLQRTSKRERDCLNYIVGLNPSSR